MVLIEFVARLLARTDTPRQVAKERLRLVLVHDRGDALPPGFLESLKEDLIKVISNYFEIDEHDLEVTFSNYDNTVALVANIPFVSIKRVAG
ncbi:MAG: cell division topological specificity factor MinE [Methylocystaceae bacterium]